MSASIGSTFHSFAYGLIRRYAPAELYVGPLRLLSRSRAGRRAARAAAGPPRVGSLARRSSRTRSAPAASPARCSAVLSRAREKGLDGEALQRAGCSRRPARVRRGRGLPGAVPHRPRRPGCRRLRRPDPPRHDRGAGAPRRAARRATPTSSSTSTRTPTPARSRCCGRSPGTAATWWSSATRTSRSTRFRGAEVRGILDFPAEFPRADGAPADVVALATTRRFGPRLLDRRPAARRPARPLPGSIPRERARGLPGAAARTAARPRRGPGRRCAPSTATGPRPSTWPTCCGGRTSRTASRGTRWRCWCARAASPSRRCAARSAPPACRSRWRATRCRWSATRRRCRCSTRCGSVLNLENDDPDHVDHIDAARAEALLTGPLGGLDAGDVRRPGPAAAPAGEGVGARRASGCRCTRASWSAAPWSTSADSSTGWPVRRRSAPRRVGELVRAGPGAARRGRDRRGAALGAVVGHRLAAPAAPTGRARGRWSPPGAPRPRLDLRAVRRGGARRGDRATTSASREFLATLVAQQIPADTLADRGSRGAAVRLLTAHRAKGLEWRLVVVAHVQQDGWPDLRRRSSIARSRPDRRRRAGPADLAARDCWSRSGGCSTSPAPAPASSSWSPPWPRGTTTASSRPGSSTSSGSTVQAVEGRPRTHRCRWRGWWPSCAATSPTRTVEPRAAGGRRPSPGPAGVGVHRRSSARADGRPLDLVGHPVGQPIGPAGA